MTHYQLTANPDYKHPYVPDILKDLPEEEQTIFYIKEIDLSEQEEIINTTSLGKGGTLIRVTLQITLAGWDNLKDHNGNIIEPSFTKSGRLDMASLNKLSPGLRAILFQEAQRINSHILDAEQAPKS